MYCSPIFHQTLIDLPLIQLPLRTASQSLLLLDIEARLLLKIMDCKIRSLKSGRLEERVAPNNKNSSPFSNDDFATTAANEFKLLREFSFRNINFIESLALYIRSCVESLLVRYEVVKSLSSIPPAASLICLMNSQPQSRLGLFHWDVPNVTEEAFDLQYLRIHECYLEAFRLSRDIFKISQNFSQLLFHQLISMDQNISDQHPQYFDLKFLSSIEKLSLLWGSLSPSSVPHFRGILWVPSLICAGCLSLQSRMNLWNRWNESLFNYKPKFLHDRGNDSLSISSVAAVSYPPATPTSNMEIPSSSVVIDLCTLSNPVTANPECAFIDPISPQGVDDKIEMTVPMGNVPISNSTNVDVASSLATNSGLHPRVFDDVTVLDYVLYNLKRIVHLAESISIAFAIFSPARSPSVLQMNTSNEPNLSVNGFLCRSPSLRQKLSLLRSSSVVLPSFQRMEETRLRILLLTEVALRQSEQFLNNDTVATMDQLTFNNEIMRRCWIISGIFMWNNNDDLVLNENEQKDSIYELCRKYEKLRDEFLFYEDDDQSVNILLSEPLKSVRRKSWNAIDSNDIRLLIMALLNDVSVMIPSTLTFTSVKNDCLSAIAALIEKHR